MPLFASFSFVTIETLTCIDILLYDIQSHSRYKHDFVTLRNIHKISQSESTIDNYVLRLAVMQTDGSHHGQEVQLLSYFNQWKSKIEVIWLGLTYCRNNCDAVARGLKQSLKLWFDINRLLAETTGDSGTGTPESLGKACCEFGIDELRPSKKG